MANTKATVKALIAFAYGLPEEQILGGEKWVSSDEYSIVAKPDSDSPIPSGDAGYLKMKTLFQQLLEDRFKLKVHSETRQGAVYNLILAKSGKLKEADSRSGSSLPTRAGHFIGTAVPIWALAQVLSQQLARPVTDKTGLALERRVRLWLDLQRNLPVQLAVSDGQPVASPHVVIESYAEFSLDIKVDGKLFVLPK